MTVGGFERSTTSIFDLDLGLTASSEKTFISRQYSRYPFHICKPLYTDDLPQGMATIYLQSSAGGIFAGDKLNVRLCAEPRTATHLTSQASTVVHRMRNSSAEVDFLITVKDDAFLEYLPDPLILFPESNMTSRLRLRISQSSTVLLSDSYLIHDPYGNRSFFSRLNNETMVTDHDGVLLCRDRNTVSGSGFSDGEIGVMGSKSAIGTFYFLRPASDPDRICEILRSVEPLPKELYFGVSTLPNHVGAWARIIAPDATNLREALTRLWQVARTDITGRKPLKRRK